MSPTAKFSLFLVGCFVFAISGIYLTSLDGAVTNYQVVVVGFLSMILSFLITEFADK